MSETKPPPVSKQPTMSEVRTTSPLPPRHRYSPVVHELDAAERIADVLFTNGEGITANRLVRELPDKSDGGGWCRAAVVREIVRVLNNE